MERITHEFALYIMLNLCRFSNYHTNSTLSKIKIELENLYCKYKTGELEYMDEITLQSLTPLTRGTVDLESHYYLDDTNLIPMCKILFGDDNKEDEELDELYNTYYTFIRSNTNLLRVLETIFSNYVHMRDKKLLIPFMGNDYLLNCEDFKLCKIENNGYQSTPERIVKYIECDKCDLGYNYCLQFDKLKPSQLIAYASNELDILQDTIHLYNYKYFNTFTKRQQTIVSEFLEREKKKNIDLFQKSKDGVYPLITTDIVNIINTYLYPEIDEDIVVKKILIDCEQKYYSMINKKLTSIEINKYIKYCLDATDNLGWFSNKKQEKMRVISYLYLFLNTDQGSAFLDKYPSFNQTVENRRKELILQVRDIEDNKWFIDILNNN